LSQEDLPLSRLFDKKRHNYDKIRKKETKEGEKDRLFANEPEEPKKG
jgi:hypothetical protein